MQIETKFNVGDMIWIATCKDGVPVIWNKAVDVIKFSYSEKYGSEVWYGVISYMDGTQQFREDVVYENAHDLLNGLLAKSGLSTEKKIK